MNPAGASENFNIVAARRVSMVECWLPYGNTEVHLTIALRDLLGVAEPEPQKPQAPPRELVSDSLSNPLGGKGLEELVDSDTSVALAIDGTITPRLAPPVLGPIVERLVSLGVPKEWITLVVGNGCRGRSDRDLVRLLRGEGSLAGVNIHEHTKDSSNLVSLGATSRRTPVEVSKWFEGADVRMAVGEVLLDSFMGFKGAQSAVLPGVSSRASIERNRLLAFEGEVAPGVVDGNPVKEDVMEAVKIADVDLAVNLVVSHEGGLLGAFSGGPEESWARAVSEVGVSYRVRAEGNADIVVVSAGGSRFDFDLHHAVWALSGASQIAKKESTIIFLAECSEGLGADGLRTLAQVDSLSELRRRFILGAEAVHLIKSTIKRNEVVLVSSLPGYLAEPLGLSVAGTLNEAYESVSRRRRGRRTVVLPYGCSTLPFVP